MRTNARQNWNTSQRCSARHCYIGRSLSKGKMLFPPLGLEKQMIILEVRGSSVAKWRLIVVVKVTNLR